MTRSTHILASTVGLLLIVAPIAGSMGGLGVGATSSPLATNNAGTATTETMAGMSMEATSSNHTTNSSATPISECQAITESGTYELTADLADNETCLNIRASNVTIRGNGHTVAQTGPRIPETISRIRPAGIQVSGERDTDRRDNVTITNVTVEGWRVGLRVWFLTGGTFRNITVDTSRVEIDRRSSNITMTDSTLNESTLEILTSDHIDIRRTTLRDSTISALGDKLTLTEIHGPTSEVQADGSSLTVKNSSLQFLRAGDSNVTVVNNSLQELSVHGSNVTVANNGPGEAGWFGIRIRSPDSQNLMIRENNITGNTGEPGMDAGITARYAHNLSITNNTITGNDIGIRISEVRNRTARECVNGEFQTVTLATGNIEIHQNTLADNGAGIQNEDTQTVNATHNYWGAANGPSSVTDDALEDPETGTLADGDGTTVSEHPALAGVSNVRFDPWLDTDPTNSTA